MYMISGWRVNEIHLSNFNILHRSFASDSPNRIKLPDIEDLKVSQESKS